MHTYTYTHIMAVQIDMQGPQAECNERTDDDEVKKNTSNSNVGLVLWLLHTTPAIRFTAVLGIRHFCSEWRLDREGMTYVDEASIDPLPPVKLTCSLERQTLVSGPEAEGT